MASSSSEVSVEESDRRRKQEESLRKFRMRECNLLVAGATNLEVGVDNVKSNLVVALEPPTTFKTFVQYKVKAKSPRSWFLIFQDEGGGSVEALSGLATSRFFVDSFRLIELSQPPSRDLECPQPCLKRCFQNYRDTRTILDCVCVTFFTPILLCKKPLEQNC